MPSPTAVRGGSRTPTGRGTDELDRTLRAAIDAALDAGMYQRARALLDVLMGEDDD